MRIGEVARRAGVNIETLRYYERRGLLAEPGRTPSGHREYDESAIRLVRAIKESQRLGFTLAEVEDTMRLARRSRSRAPEAIRVRAAAKIDEVDARISALRRIRDELATLANCSCDSLDHCTCGAAYLARAGGEAPHVAGSPFHVTNGGSTAATLRSTSLGGPVLAWQDVLHEGPVPDVAPARLRDVRARFLAGRGWGSRRSVADSLERRDRLFARALGGARAVVLWLEHDLYDQLQLLQVLSAAEAAGVEPGTLELVDVAPLVARGRFGGLGELSAGELEGLWPARRPVDESALQLAVRAWGAFRAAEPTGLAELAAGDTSPLPFLGPALRRLLEELPATGSGLTRLERGLLEPLLERPATPADLFAAAVEHEEAPFCGDAWAWYRLEGVAGGAKPLVTLANGEPLPAAPPLGDPRVFVHAPLRLTPRGQDVLAGRADRVELCGIDRWLGGTHLRPGAVWRWDPAAARVVGAS